MTVKPVDPLEVAIVRPLPEDNPVAALVVETAVRSVLGVWALRRVARWLRPDLVPSRTEAFLLLRALRALGLWAVPARRGASAKDRARFEEWTKSAETRLTAMLGGKS